MEIWNQQRLYKTLSDLVKKYGYNLAGKVEELEKRLQALESKRGPGRPPTVEKTKTGTED